MKLIAWLLVPAALFAGQARYARLGEFEGHVEVQLQAADAWMAAERNLPLVESAWLRTAKRSVRRGTQPRTYSRSGTGSWVARWLGWPAHRTRLLLTWRRT